MKKIVLGIVLGFVMAVALLPLVGPINPSADAASAIRQYVIVVEGTGIARKEFKLANWKEFNDPRDQLFFLIPEAIRYLSSFHPVYPVPPDQGRDVR